MCRSAPRRQLPYAPSHSIPGFYMQNFSIYRAILVIKRTHSSWQPPSPGPIYLVRTFPFREQQYPRSTGKVLCLLWHTLIDQSCCRHNRVTWTEPTRIVHARRLCPSTQSYAHSLPACPPTPTMVRIRLARNLLTRNAPSYTIVATRTSLRTTARPLEVLGTYNPRPTLAPPPSTSPNGHARGPEWGPPQAAPTTPKETAGQKSVVWNQARVQWWLSQGAQPSKRVEKLLVTAGVMSESLRPSGVPLRRGRQLTLVFFAQSLARCRRTGDGYERPRWKLPLVGRVLEGCNQRW